MKKSFYMYQNQEEIFDNLTDEEAGKLIKAIFDHQRGGDVTLDKTLSLIFIPFRQVLEVNSANYERKCEVNKQNIEKRWKNEAKKYDRIQSNTKNTNRNDIDIDIDIDKKEENKLLNTKDNTGNSSKNSEVGVAPKVNVFKLADKMWEQHQINEREAAKK